MNADTVAKLQVWGKGFRISQRSEEFQQLVPPSGSALDESEWSLSSVEWGGILAPLYRIDEQAQRKQFWLGLRSASLAVGFSKPSKDRHNRRSIVLVVASVEIDWATMDVANVAARAAALADRYSDSFANALAGAPSHLQQQLEDGRFLETREFSLEAEEVDAARDWGALIAEIMRWRGITGVATSYLLGLGANVLYANVDESAGEAKISRFDPDEKVLSPVGNELQLWKAGVPAIAVSGGLSEKNADRFERIDASLKGLSDEQRDLRERARRMEQQQRETHAVAQSILSLLSSWYELFTGVASGGRDTDDEE